MLSIIIETTNHEDALSRTLLPLVSGAVQGLVRDVIVLDHGSTDQTTRVAEQAGCSIVSGIPLIECISRARGDWLLLLEPGARVSASWVESVERHCASSPSPARFSRSLEGRPAFFSRIVRRDTALCDGLLISKKQALVLAKSAVSSEALARGLASRKMNAEIVPAGR